ncbi:hypothetical protein AURDEDRAFT_124325 [Auricularia subglabra TFB-10046 SS5]|nr:hypothetical protein AURDEDRAFT_124325 [Auricularia subglabra TFB-10046 SS5]
MSSRKSTSSSQRSSSTQRSHSTAHPSGSATHRSSSTTHRSGSTTHRTPEEQLASAVRSVVRANGPEAAENIFQHAMDHSNRSQSGRSGTLHSNTRDAGRSGHHRSSVSSSHPSTASSRTSSRGGHTGSSRDSAASSHTTTSSSSSHRSGSSTRSSSTADSTSTYYPESRPHYDDSQTLRSVAIWRRNFDPSYVEPVPEDDESSAQHGEGHGQLVPAPYGAPLANLATIRTGRDPLTGAHTVASFEGSRDTHGNTFILNVTNVYGDVVAPPGSPFGLFPPPPRTRWQCSCCPPGADGVYRGCRYR